MSDALHIAKTGLNAQQTRMSVISNNLANVNTVGFKRDRASFESLLYQTEREVGSQTSQNTQSPTGLSIGTGVRVAASEKLYSQGNIISTDNSLDMTVEGAGFETWKSDLLLRVGQAAEIDRVRRARPDLCDDAFVAEGRDGWLSG